MSSHRPNPWILQTRRAIIFLGSAWPTAVLLKAAIDPTPYSFVFAFIGVGVMVLLFGLASIAFALFLPTYKSRMIVVPIMLVIVYLIASGGSAALLS